MEKYISKLKSVDTEFKNDFTAVEFESFHNNFLSFDSNQNFEIDEDELKAIMFRINRSESNYKEIIKQVDTNNDGKINYKEFLLIMKQIKQGNSSSTFAKVAQGNASKLTNKFEKAIKQANEPPGKKEVVWTPKRDEAYPVQTERQLAKGIPPKKSLQDLP